MLVSHLFTRTRKQDPAGEESVNARLLQRAGFIYKNLAGVYSFLPLGFRVLENIRRIIGEEMDSLGCQEVYLNELQNKQTWVSTGRWDELKDIMYQFEDSRGKEIGLATTHEEVVTEIAKSFIHSYRDLPKAIYQIQDKFRDEPRARAALLRGREFEMKDLYSFHADKKDMEKFYERIKQGYFKIFERLGFKDVYLAEASGGVFTKEYSHEFQVVTEGGEDTIYLCQKCRLARNKEVIGGEGVEAKDLEVRCKKCGSQMKIERSIELGNIFKLGTKFSEAQGLVYQDEKGKSKPVVMASYGIGTGRQMGALVETSHDDKGMIWPEEVAPFKVYLINLTDKEIKFNKEQEREILVDDRQDVSPGEKFADADLLGIPFRVVKSRKTGGEVEVKERASGKIENMKWEEFVKKRGM
jgi:prolyl-tRNA synthetase